MAGSDVRIVLLGQNGVGKSSSGNTILGTKAFVVPEVVARVPCRTFETKVAGRKVLVTDTPGLFDTRVRLEHEKEDIVKCVPMTVPGPHVFLLVIRLGRRFPLSPHDEIMALRWIQKIFSKLVLKYTLVLFTGVYIDTITEVKDYIEKRSGLQHLISECQGRYHTFDNTNKDRTQVTDLLAKIDRMVAANGGQHYTDEMYLEAQRKIQEGEVERKRREEEKKRQQEERSRPLLWRLCAHIWK